MLRGATFIVVASMMLFAAGCVGDSKQPTQGKPFPPSAVLELEGASDSPVIDALHDVPPIPADTDEIESGFLLSRVDAYLARGATVGQVNAALASVEGAIVSMSPGIPAITIAVPRQPSIEHLGELARSLTEEPGILAAAPGREMGAKELSPGPAGRPEYRANLTHLLIARFPAAWNARKRALDACGSGVRISVVVADYFDNGDPSRLFPYLSNQLLLASEEHARQSAGRHKLHGARVTALLAAEFDPDRTFSPMPLTGANPFSGCLNIKGIPINGLTQLETAARVSRFLPTGRFILNASIGWSNDPFVIRPLWRSLQANTWKQMTRGRWPEFLAVTSAGNERNDPQVNQYPGTAHAELSSYFNISTLNDYALLEHPSLFGELVEDEPLTFEPGVADNVMIVGSTDNNCTSRDPEACVESSFSNSDALVRAVGQGVPRVFQPSSGSTSQPLFGTSYSTPQVAGLASYLWLLSSDLRENRPMRRTMDAIVRNTAGHDNLIDAYAAVLSLDAAELPSPSAAPIRHAILDANGDNRFDELDVGEYRSAYTDPSTGKLLESGPVDHGRFDLNGDGLSGGTTTAAFDLDRIGSTQYGIAVHTAVRQMIEEQEVTYDEKSLTDLNILCYYAYSPMYQGDPERRKELLASHCQKLSFTFDQDLEGWRPGTSGQALDEAVWFAGGGNPGGAIKLNGSDFGITDDEPLPNSWVSMAVDLPDDAQTLKFDTRGDPNPVANNDALLRVLIVTTAGTHLLLEWELLSGGVWHSRSTDISAFAGQSVVIIFEQDDDGEGVGEFRFIDNIEVELADSPGES